MKRKHVHHSTFDKLKCAISIIILSSRGPCPGPWGSCPCPGPGPWGVRSLSLSWSLESGPCPCPWGSGPCPVPWGQVLVNIPAKVKNSIYLNYGERVRVYLFLSYDAEQR